jgi:hypothetical protein
MWQDRGPAYVPSMRYRRRLFPPSTLIALAIAALAIVGFGAQLIHGYFWLLVHFGECMVRFLQWSGICSR